MEQVGANSRKNLHRHFKKATHDPGCGQSAPVLSGRRYSLRLQFSSNALFGGIENEIAIPLFCHTRFDGAGGL